MREPKNNHPAIWPRCLVWLLLASLLAGGPWGCAFFKTKGKTAGIEAVATVYPLGDFIRQIAGDRVKLTILVQSDKQLAALDQAQLIVTAGGSADPWISAALAGRKSKKALVIETAPGCIWLDPLAAQSAVQDIARALAVIDPAGAETYKKKAMHFIVEMANLDWEIRQTLSKVGLKRLTTLTGAWAEFARRYGLDHLILLEGIGSPVSISQEQIKQAAAKAKSWQVKTIFADDRLPESAAAELAGQSGAKIVRLDAFGDPAQPRRATYLELMRWNLANIKQSVQ